MHLLPLDTYLRCVDGDRILCHNTCCLVWKVLHGLDFCYCYRFRYYPCCLFPCSQEHPSAHPLVDGISHLTSFRCIRMLHLLCWKAELILESVHKDLARHFQTPPVASTQLLGRVILMEFDFGWGFRIMGFWMGKQGTKKLTRKGGWRDGESSKVKAFVVACLCLLQWCHELHNPSNYLHLDMKESWYPYVKKLLARLWE